MAVLLRYFKLGSPPSDHSPIRRSTRQADYNRKKNNLTPSTTHTKTTIFHPPPLKSHRLFTSTRSISPRQPFITTRWNPFFSIYFISGSSRAAQNTFFVQDGKGKDGQGQDKMGREGKGRGNGGEEEENMDRLGSGKSGFLSLYRSVRLFCGFVLLNNSKLASFDLCLSFQRSLARRASFFFFLLLFFVSFFYSSCYYYYSSSSCCSSSSARHSPAFSSGCHLSASREN